jgi:hypothetical protein
MLPCVKTEIISILYEPTVNNSQSKDKPPR